MIEKIREEIRRSGMRQEKLSAETGVPRATLSRFINGVGSIQGDALASVVAALGGRVVFPGDESASASSGDDAFRRRIAELEKDLAAANARADAYRDALALARPAPVAEEKRTPRTMPPHTPYSRAEE